MTDHNEEPSGAQQMFGDFAPALVTFTDDVLFGQVWTRPQLSPKERSVITVASLTTSEAEVAQMSREEFATLPRIVTMREFRVRVGGADHTA